jgi:hypothetical protein
MCIFYSFPEIISIIMRATPWFLIYIWRQNQSKITALKVDKDNELYLTPPPGIFAGSIVLRLNQNISEQST